MRTDYLRYQAASIQQLLRRKLSQADLLTDQFYPGSDTKIIIDLFSWTFNVLIYILNNTSSDLLFQDTFLYQNINRLTKLLSYNPGGYNTCQSQFNISLNQSQITKDQNLSDTVYIPEYTYINSGKVDSKGNDICYSFIQPYIFNTYSYINDSGEYKIKILSNEKNPVLYNGVFKKYSQVLISNGVAYDQFILNNLDLTSENKIYVDHNLFKVYIQTIDSQSGQKVYTKWNQVNSLILQSQKESCNFQLRLNQNKKYILKFGDGLHGKIPDYGAYIHILYFQSNGQEGQIDTNQINSSELVLSIDGFTNNVQLFNMLFQNESTFKRRYGDLFISNKLFQQTCNKLIFNNINKSSVPTTFQSVQEIKENAPIAFRRGSRLITQKDFESFIKQNYKSIVYDVYVANNFYYITTFYKWLNKYGKMNSGIRQSYYKFADTCDFNNVYIWMVPTGQGTITTNNLQTIIEKCNHYKCATAQLVPLNAVTTKFIPFLQHSNKKYSFKQNDISIQDYISRIKIYIYKTQTAMITNDQLKQKVNDIIVEYFLKENQHIGNTINLSDIVEKILNLNYIKSIKTVNIPQTNKNDIEIINGLSFAAFTTQLVDNKDFTIFSSSYSLQNFQFPTLFVENLLDMIQIKDTSYNITNMEL